MDYYDITVEPGKTVTIPTEKGRQALLFPLLGDVRVAGEDLEEKTAALLSDGDQVTIEGKEKRAKVLFSVKSIEGGDRLGRAGGNEHQGGTAAGVQGAGGRNLYQIIDRGRRRRQSWEKALKNTGGSGVQKSGFSGTNESGKRETVTALQTKAYAGQGRQNKADRTRQTEQGRQNRETEYTKKKKEEQT
ncbi:hypothetical protein FYJ34_00510 [Clostridiaceae bacterium 68-1-5]|uniref:Pirin C-terminal domain-containing protein n=1 Tax=Suipraeoptans intestinalis TaxID=2606628 RepID=A0A6N7UYB8_9FIRM|nr:hypothetical protein [Suipraeoptans intestinalis]